MEGPKIQRLYYSTRDISRVLHVPLHIVRAWEEKFHRLKPTKSKSGRRLYRPKDLEIVRTIKKLKDLGLTEDQIQERLKQSLDSLDDIPTHAAYHDILPPLFIGELIRDLEEILHLIHENQKTIERTLPRPSYNFSDDV
jgi:DNA-binding transcriptional MerR regulator